MEHSNVLSAVNIFKKAGLAEINPALAIFAILLCLGGGLGKEF
jgi:hypothetical protein